MWSCTDLQAALAPFMVFWQVDAQSDQCVATLLHYKIKKQPSDPFFFVVNPENGQRVGDIISLMVGILYINELLLPLTQ